MVATSLLLELASGITKTITIDTGADKPDMLQAKGSTTIATITESLKIMNQILASSTEYQFKAPNSVALAKTTKYSTPPTKNASLSDIMRKIAICESGNTHYLPNGEVIRGKVVPQDIGRYQVNENYWGETADKLGLDIFNEHENYLMAKWILENFGTKPWSASQKCWSKL
jgi:hypothetical protein